MVIAWSGTGTMKRSVAFFIYDEMNGPVEEKNFNNLMVSSI